ncbi:MAG TPA: hypothetical protein VE442_23450 [Jatrophihabitans sp.]|jgi:hypothetical protein|nr:hypothetical protein [Jatrophihabitans sp.]
MSERSYWQVLRDRRLALLLVDSTVRLGTFGLLGVLAIGEALQSWVLGVALLIGSGLQLLAASSRRLFATEMIGSDGRLAVNGLLGV